MAVLRVGALVALGALAASAAIAAGADEPVSAVGAERRPAHIRIGFESVRFPGNERVGMVGTSYLVDVNQGSDWSIGPAVYGAATGRRGGFFTFGGEAAWRTRLGGPFAAELGLYAGGGGGAAAPQGGGLMLRPHADLLWVNDGYALGLSIAKVKFPNGQIDSTQVGLVLDIETDFNFVAAPRLATPVQSGVRTGFGFDRFELLLGAYRLPRSSLLADGSAAPSNVRTLGVRVERGWGRNTYWGLEASGAAQSGIAGYAEYLATFAVEGPVIARNVDVGARVALGMAGGGGIAAGGGALVKASVYGLVRVSDDLGVAVEAGGVRATAGGRFRGASVAVGVIWALDSPTGGRAPAQAVRNDFSAGVESFKAARRDGPPRSVQADVLKIDRFIAPNLYLTGQVHSAYAGGAGGYSAALVGAGWLQPLTSRLHVGAEALAGASGGGGVDSRGSIGQATGFAGFQLTPAVALRVGAGRVKALRGPLDGNVVNMLLTVTYGVSAGG